MSAQGPVPLDPSFYALNEDEILFFKTQTGIHDESQLRDHIMAVQKEAYSIFPYPCIRFFTFTKLRVSTHPAYYRVLQLFKERKDAIFLELGCLMGNDVRKAISDGVPPENVIVSDLQTDFWRLGHRLFKTTQETFPVPFVEGDLFDKSFLPDTLFPAPTSSTSPSGAVPPLSTLTSLAPLQHLTSVIHISAVFHLFDEEKQRSLAHRVGGLLSPVPGSVIFGWDVGVEDSEENKSGGKRLNASDKWIYAHSATSLKASWAGEGAVFKPEDVMVEVSTIEKPQVFSHLGESAPKSTYYLYWSVTRV